MSKPFHPGNAARNGLLAVLLAQRDFTSSDQGIEAKRGFANVLSTRFEPEEITERLGETWEISLNTFKPFACGIVIHPIIDACIQLRNSPGFDVEAVEAVEAKVHPLVLELTGKKTPTAGLEGKFSVYHSAAVALLHGAAGEAEYSDTCVRDPRVIALRDRVSAEVEAGLHEDQARVSIRMRGGARIETFVEHAIGSLERPMSDADLEQKFRELAAGVLPDRQIEQLIRFCWDIGTLDNAADVALASVPQRA